MITTRKSTQSDRRWRDWTRRWAVLLLSAVAALALRLPARAEEPFRMASPLAGQLSRLNSRIVGGRIRVTSQNIGGQMSSTISGGGRVKESFDLDLTTAWPRLEYQASAKTFEIRLSVSAGEQVTIQRETSQETAPTRVSFKQVPEGGVELVWRSGEQSTTLAGSTLWHVWLADPKLCNSEVLPLLKLLRPSFELDKQAEALESALLVAAEQNWASRWPRWTELVAQLNDDQFARRRSADQALRSAGLAVVPFLQNIDEAQLEPEQRSRVRRIVASLRRFNEEDTPDRAALWLVGDPGIWLTLMGRDEVALRRVAANELAEILGHSIEFDPEGDASLRAGQLARLKLEITQPVPVRPAADAGN